MHNPDSNFSSVEETFLAFVEKDRRVKMQLDNCCLSKAVAWKRMSSSVRGRPLFSVICTQTSHLPAMNKVAV